MTLPLRLIALLSLSIAVGLLLGGCAKGSFENRLTTTLTGDRLFAASLYGRQGLTLELSEDDARELQRLREQSQAYEQIVRAVKAAQQPDTK